MIGLALLTLALASGGAAPASPATALAGRYSRHFTDGQVNGPDYPADDVAEVVPVDARHAYVRLALQFYNGHTCSIAGMARVEGDALVYHAPASDTSAGSAPCTLTVRREGAKLGWSDGDNSCKAHCGERGSLMHGALPWSSRRPITYIARLKASQQYRAAVAEEAARAP